jgi:hypothetical protein
MVYFCVKRPSPPFSFKHMTHNIDDYTPDIYRLHFETTVVEF